MKETSGDFIVVYVTDNGDLYTQPCESLEEAREYIHTEVADFKACIVRGEFLEDHT